MQIEDYNELIYARFNQLVQNWNTNRHTMPDITFNRTSRADGLHASGILASEKQFCYREQILNLNYPATSAEHNDKLLRIFLQGQFVHLKWQTLFKMGGIALEVEQQGHAAEWNMYYTPDAVIKMFGKMWVVEIKSMTTFGFAKLMSPPAAAVDQLNMYQHQKRIRRGIVLVDDKNNQDFKVWAHEYDPNSVKPYIKRLDTINKLVPIYEEGRRLPKRIKLCTSANSPRARRCGMSKECFAQR